MKKRNKKTFSMIRITLTIIALIAMSGVGVMAMNTKVNSVDITLSDGYKLTVLTSKTNVAEILKDNNILSGTGIFSFEQTSETSFLIWLSLSGRIADISKTSLFKNAKTTLFNDTLNAIKIPTAIITIIPTWTLCIKEASKL